MKLVHQPVLQFVPMDKKFQKSFMKCFMGTFGDFFLAGLQKVVLRKVSIQLEGLEK